MERLGEIFAKNMKEYRRKRGLTQEKLAEKVDVSTHHIGMIELARNYPTLNLVERIANALDVEIYQLFTEPHSPNEELEQLRLEIRGDMKQLLEDFLSRAFPAAAPGC
ncbi:MAG: helix-turn-helix domain-containing protein [Spirochaetaceae bacterium]|jgi:transcriptional regulator with XRE-family HTH domain|nr:helix-turn-helix domain-containing protein [Spirochaetaceae bacterium]